MTDSLEVANQPTLAPIVAGEVAEDDAGEPIPTLFVWRDPDTGALAYKSDRKGARWRSGFRDMTAIADDADDAGLPDRCRIEFVETRD
jgi:hypothetical protein